MGFDEDRMLVVRLDAVVRWDDVLSGLLPVAKLAPRMIQYLGQ